MDFVAIDFETSNGKRTSACSLGIAVVQNSKIVETKSWLIRPEPFEFSYFNLLVNGLGENVLRDKPLFCDCWEEIKPYLESKTIVAHNASFDISVLTSTLDHYYIEFPEAQFICSYKAGQKIYTNLINYRLDTIASHLGLSFNHHNAVDDAVTSAYIIINMLKSKECTCIEEFANSIKLSMGFIKKSYYSQCKHLDGKPGCKSSTKSKPLAKTITPNVSEFDENNEFYGKTVVFTGALSGMSRKRAYQLIADLGGYPADNINKSTDYLITGYQDYRLLNGNKISSKNKKALEYANASTGIQIISEEDFYKMVGRDLDEQ